MQSLVIVKNENSTATVTIDSDTPVVTPEVTTVTQPTENPEVSGVYKWNLYTDRFTYNADHTMNKSSNGKPFLNTHYASDGTYLFSSNNVVGNSVTFTSIDNVQSGVYSANIYARVTGSRAFVDVYINDVKVATKLNTGNTGDGKQSGTPQNGGYNWKIALSENNVEIINSSKITVKIVVTDVSQSGNLYLNSIELTKIADVKPFVSTDEGASIRLNEKSGIRFYTQVDNDKVESYKNNGYDVEIGTLIAPQDAVSGELTFETENFVVVEFSNKAPDGSYEYYQKGSFVGIVASIVDLTDQDLSRNFVGRGYMKLTKGDKTIIVYSPTSSSCSAKTIASKITATDGWQEIYSARHIDLINTWATATEFNN